MAMTDLIRSLIKESVMELREAFVDDALKGVTHDGESIIGDRKEAFQFAKVHLMQDIPELAHYQLVEYLPLSDVKEKWTFDTETSRGTLNTVTIKRTIKGDLSYWRFTFGEAEQSMERMVADISYQTDPMADYGDFIAKVNADWQQWG